MLPKCRNLQTSKFDLSALHVKCQQPFVYTPITKNESRVHVGFSKVWVEYERLLNHSKSVYNPLANLTLSSFKFVICE